ncbi:MAG: DUF748 domain-containing protein [Gammaproteobacteria bacterium]|nr:DUF748 domain-containing protein [Gammaproteobacteria bacterium]
MAKIIRTRWLNFRRKRFWVLSAILLYTLLGFFVAPRVIQTNIVALLEDDLGRETHIGNIDVNPFTLSLKIQGFELLDKDKTRLASFSELFVNFQLSSLFNRAWTFDQIHLNEPYFFMERFDQSDSRLKRFVTDFAAARPTEEDKPQDVETLETMPRLLIHDLALSEGHVDLKDNLPNTVVETRLTPINISIQSLNTLPDRNGKQSVTIQLAGNASLRWNGSLTLGPLDSKGELVLEGLHLDPVIAYLKSSMPLDTLAATLSTSLNYHVYMDLGSQPEVDVSNLRVELDDVKVTGLTPVTEFINIPSLALSGGTLRYPEQSLQFSKLIINQPRMAIWMKEDGGLNLLDLVPSQDESAADELSTSEQMAWQFGIDELELSSGVIELSDTSTKPVARLDIQGLDIALSGLSNQDNTSMPVKLDGKFGQGGAFNVDGSLGLLPNMAVTASINMQDMPLSLGQPYVQEFAHIQINSGALNSEIELDFTEGQNLVSSGSVQIPSLDIVNTLDHGDLLKWNLLDIDRFNFNLDAGKLHLSQLTFDQLFGTFVLDENKLANLSALMIERDEKTTGTTSPPLDFIIGGILIKDSSMDFSDLSLPLPFATHIVNLEGRVSTIDTASEAPANIKLEGQVDEYGLARIDGSMNMLDPVQHTDVTLEFRNLLMSNLSAYTAQFAGREIDQGKLDLDLGYTIEKGVLNGRNNVVLKDLELGKKVDHPDAASLPLGLAVSLLKDADGVIKVDLPVEGDVNDPQFQIGGVVWQAISGMITKLVSAPFRLLGKLIGVDSEDLGQFEFLAGRSDLTPPELEKAAQLEEALQQRPELVIEIGGVTDRSIDTGALKKIKLIAVTTDRLGKEFASQDDQAMMLDDEIRTVVENIFSERFPDVDRSSIKARHIAPPASDPKAPAVLDELAYATALWNQLLAAETVSDQDLADLAQARAQVIKDAFLSSGQFDGNRVVIASAKEVESEDRQWVVLELSVASK